MPCCMGRGRSTSSEGQQARCQDGKNCPWKKEEEKRGFGTGKTVLSTTSLHYQQVTVTVTGAVQTFLKYNKKGYSVNVPKNKMAYEDYIS